MQKMFACSGDLFFVYIQMNKINTEIQMIQDGHRDQAIILLNQFFSLVNSLPLDGIFEVRPNAARKMIDTFLKLQGTDKVCFAGVFQESELLSMIIGRIEERPFLKEERILYIDTAVTKKGHMKKGYMSSLLKYAEGWCRKRKVPVIELRALKANGPAVSYWKDSGFEEFYIRFRRKV